MGFFTKDQPIGGGLAPLSLDRIRATLDSRGANYGQGGDNELGGYWDGHLMIIMILGQSGEYLCVRGRWNRTVGAEHLGRLREIANDWNAEKLWPKAYVTLDEEEDATTSVGVYTEHTVDYEHGVSDEQIDLHLACAIATSGQFFDKVDEYFPAEAERARAEFESQ